MIPERWAQVEGCRAAQASLSETLEGLTDEVVRRPSLPRRLHDPATTRRLLAWLIGRADQPGTIELDPWG